ncbi:MAG: Ig-like domain-containing protein [Deltaproteobacteria bacterium]|nr:Ig-like domain-containing protein [Deltaproteobacteria bacterium]
MKFRHFRCLSVMVAIFPILLLAGCSGTAGTLTRVPFMGITVKVVDEKDQPIVGAIVEASDGQQITTGADGLASLKLGAVGVKTVNVMAQDRVPSSFTVTMPMDRGKTMTARLGTPVEMSANINISTGGIGGMMMGQIYPMMFQSLFVAYGYNMELIPYIPGQWTEWHLKADGDDKPAVMRRAFLNLSANKEEWWQMKLKGEEEDEDHLFEVMFNKNRESLRRMRQKMGNEEPKEVPVTEGWYTRPMELTPESLKGAVKKTGVSIKVPAGIFNTDMLEFATMGAQGAVRLYRAKDVPGGLVKAEYVDEKGKTEWSSELSSYGSGAKTELGSY